MVTGLESVTIGVVDVDSALASFRGVAGLRRESDANASVSLLAAWRYPVHADVRLVELACDEGAGRVRLARFDPARSDPNAGQEAPDPGAGSDDEATRRFYGEGLGLPPDFDSAIADDMLKAVRRLADADSGGDRQISDLLSLCAQLSQPKTPGHVGINLLSLGCDDLDALEARLRELDAEIVTRPTHVALGDGAPTRVLLARGPRQELLEFVERSE